jgi:hypothetical protein
MDSVEESVRLSPSLIQTSVRVRYIKLGSAGIWEKECLDRGIIRIGFGTESSERFLLCQSSNWPGLVASFIAEGKDKGTATRFTNELRLFFEDDGTTLWITFMNERLYWCFVDGLPPELHADGDGVWCAVRGEWRGKDNKGTPLSKDKLSGALTKLAAYRATSCAVDKKTSEYVIRRINGQRIIEVEQALDTLREMHASVRKLMRMLTWQDFELLVDLVFTTSGWRRQSVVGRTQDTKDFDLLLPSTGERAFVQVKSSTTPAEFADYSSKFRSRSDLYERMFYVYHSGEPLSSDDSSIKIIDAEHLAKLVVDAGLVNWLISKVS